MFERFTDRARRVIVLAQEEARTLQHNYIGTEHLLLGLIREGEGVAAKALASKGVELEATRKQVEEMIGKGNAAPNGHIPFTPHAKQVLEFSLREALQLGHSYIGTEHILLGLIREGEGVGTQVLIKMDVDLGELRSATIDMIRGNSGTSTDGKGDLANAGGVADKQNKSGSAILDQFGRNLTAEAAEGKLDPVIGRTNEIERVMVVLSRRTKNNPDEAIKGQDFEKAAELRDNQEKLEAERKAKEDSWREGESDVKMVVDEDVIAEVISSTTGIPVFKLTQAESKKLLNMEAELHKRIIGQDEAVSALSRSIRRTRVGLKDPKRPSGSFIFAGPTGVGKTELAKTLAEFLFDDEDALIRVDMSEFSEKYAASRLFGAPPGYVGYEEGGELTEKVRRKPFSVVLFDEIEKAHPDIFNTLLQVLDDGHLTDGQGRKVDFKNTIIILTTNLGTRDIAKAANTGFNLGANSESSYQRMKDQVSSELKQQFRPEFLNRLDDIIVFKQLSEPQVRQIVDLDVKQLNDRLFDRHMSLELTDAAKDLLAQKGFDPLLGARPLRRVIQRDIEDAISEKILMGDLEDGQKVIVDAEGEGLLGEFTFKGETFEQPEAETGDSVSAVDGEAGSPAETESEPSNDGPVSNDAE